ncbi:hypothetical protein CO115_04595 [Candidatus Falkowbacteria bacterium CG_4_9_14_3_um_filter_36_9]|nr:MAG: hypothetical protein CO115_04595 [Candidatus Falkowbacteria bacterium CG_4_9_14_3_um_filter_36_9]
MARRSWRPNPNQFLYVGVDIHKDKHTTVATNCFGHKLLKMEFADTGNNFRRLVAGINNSADYNQ